MEWKEVTASEFCSLVTDGTHDSPKAQSNGHYLITSKHLKPNGVDFESANLISEEDYQKAIKRSRVDQFDILFSMIGTIGLTYRETAPTIDYAVKNMAIFKMGGDEAKSIWLYYWLQSPKAKTYIRERLAGSTQSYLTLDSIRKYPVRYPEDESAMRRISSILSSLDRKIELNNKINATLEEMAQALFKSWFVDFEPFKNGNFIDTEIGKIPEGWRVGTLGEITTNVTSKVGKREDVKVLSPVTSGQLMLSEEYFTKQVFSASIAKYKVVKQGDFAYNPARVNIGSLGRNDYDFDGCVSPVYIVFSAAEGYAHYIDLFRRTERFKTSVISRAIGGVRQSLSYDDFSMIECIIAPQEVVESFNAVYEKMKELMVHNSQESLTLSHLRDTLLPRLMSGEIEL